MDNRQVITLSAVAIAAVLLLFVIKLLPFANTDKVPEKFISHNDVRGSAVVHNGLPYTLNFQQQTSLLNYLNQSLVVGPSIAKSKDTLPISKIILYRFNASPIEISPVSIESNDLIFSSPLWNPNGYLKDISDGPLVKLLNSAFDN